MALLPVFGHEDYSVGSIFFSLETPVNGKKVRPGNGVHIAFTAQDPAMVDEFHRVALDHGGADDGAPGLRPEYNPHYYGTFVRDPDGNKIEAVTHAARQAAEELPKTLLCRRRAGCI